MANNNDTAKVNNSLDDGHIHLGLASGFPSRLFATFICGVWVTASASQIADLLSWSSITADSYVSYCVAVGAGGILFPLIALMMLKLCSGSMEKELYSVKDESITAQKLWGIFLVLWWGFGAFFGTFHSPFTTTGNGYFALWAGFLFSLAALGDVMESVKTKLSTTAGQIHGSHISGPALGLFFAAVILLIATIRPVDAGSNTNDFAEALFGMIASAVTILICLVLMMTTKLHTKIVQVIGILLGLTWAAVAGIMTFRAPFTTTGNGYFASYFGLFMAWKLFGVAVLEK